MTRRIPLIARDLKRLYTGFLLVAVILFLLCSYLTEFNPMVLAANGDAFWEFITEDFLPPALPKASRIPGIFSSVLVTLALAMAAILAFFVALFGSEKVSPFPRFAKVVRGFATFLRNIPALVWAFILFSSLGIGTGVGFVALCITSFAFMVRAFVETMEDVSQDCVESLGPPSPSGCPRPSCPPASAGSSPGTSTAWRSISGHPPSWVWWAAAVWA